MKEAKEMAGDVLSTAHDSDGDREGSPNRLPASVCSAGADVVEIIADDRPSPMYLEFEKMLIEQMMQGYVPFDMPSVRIGPVCCHCNSNRCDTCEDEICPECWDENLSKANALRRERIASGWVADCTGAIHPPNVSGEQQPGDANCERSQCDEWTNRRPA